MNLPQRLIIADPGLRGTLGHHLGYSLAVAEAARTRGIAALVLSSGDFRGAVPGGIRFRPSFAAAYQTAGGGGALRRAVFGVAARAPPPLAARVAPLLQRLRRGSAPSPSCCAAHPRRWTATIPAHSRLPRS